MAKKIAMDLGSENILIFNNKQGIIINEPSVVAIEKETKNIVEIGTPAYEMVGRTPGKIKAFHPIRNGVIDDFSLTEGLILELLKRKKVSQLITRPTILIIHPSNITNLEKEAFNELGEALGAKNVILEEKSKIISLGLDIDINKPKANMIVDIGSGITEVAVLSLNEIVVSSSIKTAGRSFNEDIKKYIKTKYKILIGDKTAEEVKTKIGCIHKIEKEEKHEIKGRNLITGLPNSAYVTSKEIKEAIKDSVSVIVKSIKQVLESTPPELSGDIVDFGLNLTGGSSKLKGIKELLEEELKIPITIIDEPTECIENGFKKYFELM